MELKQQIIAFYQYFYCKLNRNDFFVFYPNCNQQKKIDLLIELFDIKYGKYSYNFDKLYEYFLYQFNFWHDKKTSLGKGKVQFSWVISEKAFARYSDAIENKSIFYSYDIIDKYLIDKKEIYDIIFFNKDDKNITNIYDIERSRYLNTDYGLFHCLSLTKGFSSNSNYCKKCINKEECFINGNK